MQIYLVCIFDKLNGSTTECNIYAYVHFSIYSVTGFKLITNNKLRSKIIRLCFSGRNAKWIRRLVIAVVLV